MADASLSRKAHCAEDLRRRILTQDLEPGGLLDETELAAAYDLSRPPLREVLRQLSGGATWSCARTGWRRSRPCRTRPCATSSWPRR